MSTLAQQRCFHHALREAVARCPECRRYYCRECITEHEERLICSSCLRLLAAPPERPGWRLRLGWMAAALVPGLLGIIAAWFFFYAIGAMLLSVPTSFHDGSLWSKHWHQER